MCTVTYIPSGDGIFLTSNRDERRGRAVALEPSVYEGSTGHLLYPKDAQAGGTWFAVHEKGHVLILLNGARVRHTPRGPYRKSRGLVLLDVADSESPLDQFKRLDLEGIEPFTLVLLEDGQLHECRWDGATKHHREPDPGEPHIWSSVTLYDQEVIQKREGWFAGWLLDNPDPGQETILRFHQFTGDGDRYNDLLMNRDDRMLTVSITSLRYGGGGGRMTYLDIPGRRSASRELKWAAGALAERESGERCTGPVVNMNWIQRQGYRPFFIRLFNWEYWSFAAVYFPIYIIWVGLCLRARSFFFFAAANPGIRNGGFLNESKKDICPLIPACFHPRTLFFALPADGETVAGLLREQGFRYPLIGKPDIGGRGRGVKVLRCEGDVIRYANNAALDFHIQEFVNYDKEVGIFYYRYPGEDRGRLSGIVRKEFLAVKGDGRSSVAALLRKNKRAILQLPTLEKLYGPELDTVLPEGEDLVLVPYGNHARGAKFVDDSHLIDEQLTDIIDHICRQIPDFYFGRLDIRYRDWEELKQGKGLAIIEVNGAGSEPTHIYDPVHSLFFAWKEIIRHWVILWRISRRNHDWGARYLSVREGVQMFREDKVWSAKLDKMKE